MRFSHCVLIVSEHYVGTANSSISSTAECNASQTRDASESITVDSIS